ncbi:MULTISPECIES: hypothetical protein [unclassified Nocardioides]|uniref:hypothetical protein n=1 Tax=unclassified Nocardioides TaxID=2615069 RepID=UPI000B21060C|nr:MULTISPECIES: hypothetical protein [unclassified Nocardioides]
MFRKRVGVISLAAAVASIVLSANPAYAAENTKFTCVADGQTATLSVTHDLYKRTIYRIEYKIEDNGRGGGKIWVNDYGTAPTLTYYTGSAIQDGAWHVMRETNIYRGGGGLNVKFTLNQAVDSSCGGWVW